VLGNACVCVCVCVRAHAHTRAHMFIVAFLLGPGFPLPSKLGEAKKCDPSAGSIVQGSVMK